MAALITNLPGMGENRPSHVTYRRKEKPTPNVSRDPSPSDLNGNEPNSHQALHGNGDLRPPRSRLTPQNTQQAEEDPKARVCFNVGGVIFQTTEATVKRTGNKKFQLNSPKFLKKYYDEDRNEYFFDRDPEVFRSVLNYWRTGRLHVPASMCGPQVKEELNFWGLREVDIQPCCWNNFNRWMQTVESLEQLEKDRNPAYMRSHDVDRHDGCCHVARQRLWKLLTDPSHSRAAKIYAYVAMVFVLLAIFSFCASTHSFFSVSVDSSEDNSSITKDIGAVLSNSQNLTKGNVNLTDIITGNRNKPSTLPPTPALPSVTPVPPMRTSTTEDFHRQKISARIHPVLFVIDILCLVFFTVEYLVKLFCASPRCQFVRSFTAVLDVLAIVPDFVEFGLYIFWPAVLAGTVGFMEFLPFLRLMRAFRIFRLIRRVPGLWIMMYTLRASFKELSLMLIFLLVGTMLFASIIFFVDDPNEFHSIPHGFWWAIVTMTTVGYGDMAPKTAWGQIVGSVTAICGVLIVGFTIPSLVNNFITYYNHIEFVVQKERWLRIIEQEEKANQEAQKRKEKRKKMKEEAAGKQQPTIEANGEEVIKLVNLPEISIEDGSKDNGRPWSSSAYTSGAGHETDNLLPGEGNNNKRDDDVDNSDDEDDDDGDDNAVNLLYPHRVNYRSSCSSLVSESAEKD